MKRLAAVYTHHYTHPYVYWKDNMICTKFKISHGSSLGVITGIPRPFHRDLFLLRGCFYLYSEMILDARYTHNPLAWIIDGFFDDLTENVYLVPLCNPSGFIYGVNVIASMDIEKCDALVYHTMLPI